MEPWITWEAVYPDVDPPSRATWQSAGYDLRAYLKNRTITIYKPNNEDYDIHCNLNNPTLALLPGERALIPLGFKAQLPHGFEAQIRPRSSRALKLDLTVVNSPGTIDADFPDEWALLMVNRSAVPVVIDHNEAIAQLVLAEYRVLSFVRGEVRQTTNRRGGYGSTDAPKAKDSQ